MNDTKTVNIKTNGITSVTEKFEMFNFNKHSC